MDARDKTSAEVVEGGGRSGALVEGELRGRRGPACASREEMTGTSCASAETAAIGPESPADDGPAESRVEGGGGGGGRGAETAGEEVGALRLASS